MGFGMGKGSNSPAEIETRSQGNLLLILAGLKTRFVGLGQSLQEGELAYIKNGDLKVPIIVEKVEKDRPLAGLLQEEWHAAGHASGIGYATRMAESSNAREGDPVDAAQLYLNTARTNNFTFRLATRKDLLERGIDPLAAAQDANEVANALKAEPSSSVDDARKFAQDSLRKTGTQVDSLVKQGIAAMQFDIGVSGAGAGRIGGGGGG